MTSSKVSMRLHSVSVLVAWCSPLAWTWKKLERSLILQFQWHHVRGSLDLQISPETVLVSGNRLDHYEICMDAELDLSALRC